MTSPNFTTTILVDQTPKEVFNAIKNVRGWWSGLYSEEIEGNTDNLNDEFTYRAGEGAHYSKQKLVELIPGEKVEWLITESQLNFVKDKQEWTGTKIRFDISKKGDKTELRFTHTGLLPQIECYDACSNAWTQYVQGSLFKLITTGKGQPSLKEG